jgi:hypothetical protein
MNAYKDTILTGTIGYIISLVISSVAGLLLFFLIFPVVLYFSPALVNVDGVQYSVMPIGQLFISGFISLIATITLSVILYRKFKKRLRANHIALKPISKSGD